MEGVTRKIPAGAVLREGTIKSNEPEIEAVQEVEIVDEAVPKPVRDDPPISKKERKRRRRTEHGSKPVPEQVPPKQPESEAATDVSGNIKKGATELELADVSGLPTEGGAWIGSAERGMHITWTGISGTTLTGVKGLRRAVPKGSQIVLDEPLEEEEEDVDDEPRTPKF